MFCSSNPGRIRRRTSNVLSAVSVLNHATGAFLEARVPASSIAVMIRCCSDFERYCHTAE
jgi:hypothetical protein